MLLITLFFAIFAFIACKWSVINEKYTVGDVCAVVASVVSK